MSKSEYWESVIANFRRLIDGDRSKALKYANQALGEIECSRDAEYAGEVARAWLRILEPIG